MNGNAMRKKLGPVADDVAMFLSGVDGFLYDLRDFSAVRARTWMGIAFVHEPEGRLLHSFGKHINNMLWHDSFDSGTHGAFVPGFRGFLVVQGMVQPFIETGSTGSHGSGQVPVLACGAGGGGHPLHPLPLLHIPGTQFPAPVGNESMEDCNGGYPGECKYCTVR